MRFDESTQALQPGASVTTEVPAREATIKSDVLVPLLQALLTGGFVASLFTLAVAEFAPKFPYGLFKLWGMVTLLIAAIAWLILLGQHRKLLWAIERMTNTDLDGDGHEGEPQPKRTIRVEVMEDGSITKYFDAEDFGIDDDNLVYFCSELVGAWKRTKKWDLTEGKWGGDRKAFPEGINQFRRFRSLLEKRGYIIPESGAQNAKRAPTGYGASVFKRIAEMD